MNSPNKNNFPLHVSSHNHLREKRKWQIALRRYVLEQQKSTHYAPYFALDIPRFREWISLQFTDQLSWENFSSAWQFDHLVPVSFFDFSNEQELKLCWNFTNIRVLPLSDQHSRRAGADLTVAETFFKTLFHQTGYPVCGQMIQKINELQQQDVLPNEGLPEFLLRHKEYLELSAGFTEDDFVQLNGGKSFQSIIYEKEFLKKFGG